MGHRTAPPGEDDEAAALYRASLGDFVDARNALAARLRKAGDGDASARVKALPKPGAPAWALNQVYWHARAEYDRLIAAGDQLRSLQQQMLRGHPADPRASMQERQAAVRQVVDRAARFLAEAGQPATDATRQRISVTAEALATWGSQPQGYVPGRLDRDIDPPGFAALAALGPPPLRLVTSAKPDPAPSSTTRRPPPATRPTAVPSQAPATSQSAAAKRAAEKAAREAARVRESERTRLARDLQQAERDVHLRAQSRERAEATRLRAADEAARNNKEVAALEQQLAAVRTRLERAERAREQADAAAAEASRAHAEAEKIAARARQALEQLGAD